MKTVLELSHSEARQFFLKQESYCNMDLPDYFTFQSLLNAISAEIDGKEIGQIQCDDPKKLNDVNYTILGNKDGKFAWRPLQLINPVLYVFLVHKITEKTNWKFIVERFSFFQNNTQLRCCSIPIEAESENESNKASTVANWWETIEQQSLELSLNFDYLLNTDVTDCYGSMYTHTIPLALHNKNVAKVDHSDKYIGNRIDGIIRAMQNGQTNGIPQGSVLMDFIAEMVLGYADIGLFGRIQSENITDYQILRYRDDYRIFTNSHEDAVKIVKLLTETLIDLNLRLNSSKTFISNDIIQDAIKPDKMFWLGSKRKEESFQKTLLLIHSLAKKHPNSGSVARALSDTQRHIYEQQNFDNENVKILINIVVDIAYKNPRMYPMATAILSKLLSLLNDNQEIDSIVASIEKTFMKIPNVGHLQIWLQRLTLKIDEMKNYNERLCKKVIDGSIEIWNTDWLNNTIKNIFAQNSIINVDYIQSMDKIIKPEEVQLFEVMS